LHKRAYFLLYKYECGENKEEKLEHDVCVCGEMGGVKRELGSGGGKGG